MCFWKTKKFSGSTKPTYDVFTCQMYFQFPKRAMLNERFETEIKRWVLKRLKELWYAMYEDKKERESAMEVPLLEISLRYTRYII